jgi:hypothetical protein
MSNDELERLMARTHKEVTLFDYNGIKVPCIILEGKRFDDIMKAIVGKPISVDTNLNILQDGLGHVFVDMSLSFSQGGIVEKLLLYANDFFEFFEALAKSSMLALSSPHSEYGESNVFMVQLPKPERAIDALEIIKKGLKK